MRMAESQRPRALHRRHFHMSAGECEEAVRDIYAKVKPLTHRGNSWESNTGEVFPSSVSHILRIVGPIGASDVFLDVGSGLGNIVCQVLLQTSVLKAIGMEKQKKVLEVGQTAIAGCTTMYRRLKQAEFRCDDVSTYAIDIPEYARDVTIIYSNNVRFNPDANYSLFHLASKLPKTRMLITAVELCPRHSLPCPNELCALWKRTDIVQTQVSWTNNPVWFNVYQRADQEVAWPANTM